MTINPISKNTTSFTNQARSGSDLTWDKADFPWNEAEGTWDNPVTPLSRQTKNTPSFVNQPKN